MCFESLVRSSVRAVTAFTRTGKPSYLSLLNPVVLIADSDRNELEKKHHLGACARVHFCQHRLAIVGGGGGRDWDCDCLQESDAVSLSRLAEFVSCKTNPSMRGLPTNL